MYTYLVPINTRIVYQGKEQARKTIVNTKYMLRTRYVYSTWCIYHRGTSCHKGYAYASTPPNNYIFFCCVSFVLMSVIALPTLLTHCITIYKYIRMCTIFLFFICLASCLKNDFLPPFCALIPTIFFLIFTFLILICHQYVVRVLSSVQYQELLYANSLGGSVL